MIDISIVNQCIIKNIPEYDKINILAVFLDILGISIFRSWGNGAYWNE